MKNKICWMSFGKKKDRITIVHMNKPIRHGLVGMVVSKLFDVKIPLIIDEKALDDSGAVIASLAVDKDRTLPRIYMEREVFYGFKRGEPMARMTVFHELGHLVHGDLSSEFISKDYDEERKSIAETGDVLKVELDADAFAAEYLGTETVVAGLVALKKKIIDEYGYDEIPLKEIEQRIKRLEMKKEKSEEI